MTTRLSLRDALLALGIVFVWGTNFAIIRIGLDVLPPLFFVTLRFALVFLPAALFVKRPKVPWKYLILYGICSGPLQFGLLFFAMNGMISPGLASLMLQMQVFFTIAIAMGRQGERVAAHQMAAFGLALAGMGVIAAHNGHGVTLEGLALVLLAAMSWAISNQTAREAARDAAARGQSLNMLGFIVWAALVSTPLLLAASLASEGPAAILKSVHQAGLVTWAAVIWQSSGNTMFGFACWAWLLARYPAATISPMSLLVPVFGFAASAVLLGEPLPLWKIGATLLIMGGLGINLLWRPKKIVPAGD
ncbi:MAG TPA: EamA family transporter [Rhizomicrobium sp.]